MASRKRVVMRDSDMPDHPRNMKEPRPETAQARNREGGIMIYRLKALMNVRDKPSRSGKVMGILTAGSLVEVKALKGDWLYLVDGRFILYEDGEYAEKV